MSDPIVLKHSLTVRCTGVTAKPPTGKHRTARVFSAALAEVDNNKAGLLGAALLKDLPEDVARALADGISPNRVYELSFKLTEVPDKQRDLFKDQEEDRALAENAGEPSSSPRARSARTLHSPLERVKRTHRSRGH